MLTILDTASATTRFWRSPTTDLITSIVYYLQMEAVRTFVKSAMKEVARGLNALSGGRLTPNMVTIVGLLAHIPIAWLIANNYLAAAGLWLIVFGLFDTLDGELARLQKSDSPAGMFLDSVTDRMKEVIIYTGISVYLSNSAVNVIACSDSASRCLRYYGMSGNQLLAITILLLGGSMLTSYINAWGEAVMSRSGAKTTAMNKVFRGGLAGFEVRIALLVLGLITGLVLEAMLVIGVLVVVTIVTRLSKVFRELKNV